MRPDDDLTLIREAERLLGGESEDEREVPTGPPWPAASGPQISSIDQVPSVRGIASAQVNWLIEGLLAEGTVNLVAGESGHGKTTLALALADAVARGADFAGMRTSQRRVLVLDRENPISIVVDRLEQLKAEDGDSLRIWGGWLPEEAPDPAGAIVQNWILSCTPRPFIVVDALVAFNQGAENDSSETRDYMHHYRQLANLGATLLVLHNSGKSETSKDYRGSSDIKASVDTAFHLANIGESARLERLELRVFKSRFLMDAGRIVLRYKEGTFYREAREESQIQTNEELLIELLKGQPSVKAGDFENLALGRGIPRNRARAFLRDGVRAGTIHLEIGAKNTKHYRLPESNAEGENGGLF